MRDLHYYYSAHSAFAYLGSSALMQICARHDLRLIHKPIPLSPVVEGQGSLPFAKRTQAHVDYFFGREIERWAELRNVPILSHRPTHHDAPYDLASRMIIALGDKGERVDEFAHAVLEAHWLGDADLSDERTLLEVANRSGLSGVDLMEAANAQASRDRYEANMLEARSLSVFGSPTYIFEGEVFYGQDRLEMLERAVTTPFAPTVWVNPPVDPA